MVRGWWWWWWRGDEILVSASSFPRSSLHSTRFAVFLSYINVPVKCANPGNDPSCNCPAPTATATADLSALGSDTSKHRSWLCDNIKCR